MNDVELEVLKQGRLTLILAEMIARKSCKHCWGRGYVGVRLDRKAILCSCVEKRIKKMDEAQAAAFKDMAQEKLDAEYQR